MIGFMLSTTQQKPSTALEPGAHFGQVKSVRRMGSLIVAESRYSANFLTPPHWHETASFTMVFGGSYQEDFSRKRFECFAGSVLYRPAGEVHKDRIGASGAHCLMVEMPEKWLAKIRVFQAQAAEISAPRQCLNDARIAFRLRRELALSDEFSSFAVEALAVELACEMRRTPGADRSAPRWLAQLRNRIEAEFATLPSVTMLANNLGIHPGHMARAFRKHFGCTITEYARQRRVEYCCEHLRRGSADLCELAAGAGFSSQAHMTRVFRLHTAMTPGQYRRSHRAG